MTNPVFAATYSDWRLVRTRGVVQIVLEIPLEKADAAYQVLGGMPVAGKEKWFAVAALKSEPADKPNKRLVTQAAIACNDPQFQKYLKVHWSSDPDKEAVAALIVRSHCGVTSRSEILPGTLAAEKWDQLWGDFIVWRDKDKYVEKSA